MTQESEPTFIEKLKLAWLKLTSPRWLPLLYAEVGAAVLLAIAFLPGGFDYLHYFHRLAQGCETCTYNPYFTEWFLWPLSVLPWRAAYLLLGAVGIAVLWFTARRLGGNPFVALMSAPFLWVLWLGQIDVLPVLGLGIAWWAFKHERPLWVGLGLLLLATKPQVSGFAILLLLWWAGWRALIIPGAAALLSAVVYGIDWPLRWLSYTPETMFDGQAWFYVGNPLLLLTLLGVFFIHGQRDRLQYVVAATLVGAPYLGAYSFFVLLVFPLRWWEVAIGYLPFAVMGITGTQSPLVLLLAQPLLVMVRLFAESRLRTTAAAPTDKAAVLR
jgi:hypothetical protein